MATKQVFIQIVDKKSGRIEEVINSKTLEAMDIDQKVALTKGKELYIVTHKVEPIIKIEMKQKKIVEPISYIEHEENLTLVIDDADEKAPVEIEEEIPQKTSKKASKKTEKKAIEEEAIEKMKKTPKKQAEAEDVPEKKKRAPRKKKTD